LSARSVLTQERPSSAATAARTGAAAVEINNAQTDPQANALPAVAAKEAGNSTTGTKDFLKISVASFI
jgi:hypothetical protein